MRPKLSGLAFVACAAVAMLGLLASPAAAHAVLVESDPVDGGVLDAPPREVVLRFNEPVSVPPRGIRLYDQTAEQRSLGSDTAAASEEITLPVEEELRDGAYILTWRVVSGDGHLVRGAFQFSVGTAVAVEEGTFAAIFSDASATRWTIAGAVVRTVGFLGTLLGTGITFFLGAVWRRAAQRQDATGADADATVMADRRLQRLGAWAAFTAAVAAVTLVAVQVGALADTGTVGMLDAQVWAGTIASPFGIGMLLRTAALVALGALLVPVTRRALHAAMAASIAAVGSFVLVGHSALTQPRWFAWIADGIHVAAAAVWFGGLVALGAVLWWQRHNADAAASATAVSRYSQVAAAALTAVAASGAGLAWLEVRALRALLTTAYGQTLLVKLAVVAVVVAVAAYNRYRLVPAVHNAGQLPAGRWRLRRTVTAEAGLMAAVLAVTAVLVSLQPAREAAGIGGMFTADVAVADHTLNLTVDPNRAGANEVHLYLLDETGRPVDADGVTLRFTMATEEIGPLEREPLVAGPGHWVHVGPELQFPGTWQIEATVTLSRFERETEAVTVTVNP
jgi:copper transport protein